MKYANIGWQETVRGKKAAVNLGDNLQFLAIDYLYHKMGIKDITYLNMSQAASYRGEKLTLPLNWALFDANYMRGEFLNISKDIQPVFLGMTICSREEERFFNKENIAYLNANGPVGCRDAYTYQKLSQYGINAYLNGCVTITLPKRKKPGKKLFLADAPIELKSAVEEHLGTEYECISQQVYLELEGDCTKPGEIAARHYRYILENAAAVVTSRLHIASPCAALGIPVLFARKKLDIRFGWIDRLIKLYAENEFSGIDWNLKAASFEEAKQMILENDIRRIDGGNDAGENEKISRFFSERMRREYDSFANSLADIDKLKEYIHREWDKKSRIRYVLWGLNGTAEKIYHYIAEEFPLAEIAGVIDDYKEEEFYGVRCVAHRKAELDDACYVLVTAVAASNAAYGFFGERERMFLLGDVFVQGK